MEMARGKKTKLGFLLLRIRSKRDPHSILREGGSGRTGAPSGFRVRVAGLRVLVLGVWGLFSGFKNSFSGFLPWDSGFRDPSDPPGGPNNMQGSMLVEATRFAPVATLLFSSSSFGWPMAEEEGRPVRSLLSLLFLRTSVVYSLLCFLSSLDETSYSLLHFFSSGQCTRPTRETRPDSQPDT